MFLKIQEDALEAIAGSRESIAAACQFLYASGLGWGFSLRFILEQLGKLGIDLKKRPEIARIDDDPADPYDPEMRVLNNDFILSTLKFAEFHALREIKHRARIPVKDSYVLVGVADEGPEYRERKVNKIGDKKVFCLVEGNVFGRSLKRPMKRPLPLKVLLSVCIQRREDPEPRYLEGPCLVSRNPVVHPGDSKCCLVFRRPCAVRSTPLQSPTGERNRPTP